MTPSQILDLASRYDGYLTSASDPAIGDLLDTGRVTARYVGGGYTLLKAVPVPVKRVYPNRAGRGRWSKPVIPSCQEATA